MRPVTAAALSRKRTSRARGRRRCSVRCSRRCRAPRPHRRESDKSELRADLVFLFAHELVIASQAVKQRRNLMRKTFSSASLAAVVACAVVVAAQTPQPSQTQSPQLNQSITVAGCVQKEADVLKRAPMAANVGMSDEFVL